MLIPIRKNSVCFPAGANGAHKAPHPVSPVSHASRYNTLHFASKVVCQRGHPFGNPGQQNRRYAALSGSIPPFVVSSPFHGLFSPFVKFGVISFIGTTDELASKVGKKYNIKIVSELGENEYSAVNVADTLLSILEEYKQKNIDIFDIKVNRGTLEQHFINLSRGV